MSSVLGFHAYTARGLGSFFKTLHCLLSGLIGPSLQLAKVNMLPYVRTVMCVQ